MGCEDPIYAAQNPAECLVEAGGELVAGSALDKLLGVLADAMIETQKLVMTFWMEVPSANPLTTPYTSGGGLTPVPQAPQLTSALETTRESLFWLMAIVAVLGIIAAAVRTAMTNRASDLVPIPKMLFTLIAVSLFGTTAVWVGIQLSDAYAPWILQRAGAGDLTGESFIKRDWIIKAGLVSGGLNVLIGVLAGFAQIVFMFFRGALLLLMLAVWPTVAAGTATETGMSAFKKMNAWIIALLLYKPVAANVYALGFLVYARDSEIGVGGDLMSLLLGTTLLVLAAISLPMLIRFVMPPAGVGVSSAFSGGAVIGGIATGAVAVAALGGGVGARTAASGSSRLVGGFQPGASAGGATGTAGGRPAGGTGGPRGQGSGGSPGPAAGPGSSGGNGSQPDHAATSGGGTAAGGQGGDAGRAQAGGSPTTGATGQGGAAPTNTAATGGPGGAAARGAPVTGPATAAGSAPGRRAGGMTGLGGTGRRPSVWDEGEPS